MNLTISSTQIPNRQTIPLRPLGINAAAGLDDEGDRFDDFDEDENEVEPVGHNPFAPKVLPM